MVILWDTASVETQFDRRDRSVGAWTLLFAILAVVVAIASIIQSNLQYRHEGGVLAITDPTPRLWGEYNVDSTKRWAELESGLDPSQVDGYKTLYFRVNIENIGRGEASIRSAGFLIPREGFEFDQQDGLRPNVDIVPTPYLFCSVEGQDQLQECPLPYSVPVGKKDRLWIGVDESALTRLSCEVGTGEDAVIKPFVETVDDIYEVASSVTIFEWEPDCPSVGDAAAQRPSDTHQFSVRL